MTTTDPRLRDVTYSPDLHCGCGDGIGITASAARDDEPAKLKLVALLKAAAHEGGWYWDGNEWKCDKCAPSAVDRLGELADG